VSAHGAIELITSEGDKSFKVNGQRVKPYLGGDLPKERVGIKVCGSQASDSKEALCGRCYTLILDLKILVQISFLEETVRKQSEDIKRLMALVQQQ